METVDNQVVGEAFYTTVIVTDKDGNIVSEITTSTRHKNGSGFMIGYCDKINKFVETTRSGSVLRVFFYIASRQNYGTNGLYGYRCTREHLCKKLNLDRKSIYTALEHLKEKFMIVESKIDGQTEFMVNPAYVTIGKNRHERIKVWNERWMKNFEANF